MSSLLSDVLKPLGVSNPVEAISPMKEMPALHKPFDDVQAVLAVSLGYLRNLEIPILTADSMPSF